MAKRMLRSSYLRLKPVNIENLRLPPSDYVNAQFDNQHKQTTNDKASNSQAKSLLLILSTPRSGSTYFTELLKNAEHCIAHEYFQSFQYLPILSKRWQVLYNNKVHIEKYTQALIQNRTSKEGVLGIKLHGRHIKTFTKFKPYFDHLPTTCVVLQRCDIIAQAVSYEIASQTSQWSAAYTSKVTPVYSFNGILHRMQSIQSQNEAIDRFLQRHKLNHVNVSYEQLIDTPNETLAKIGLNTSNTNDLVLRNDNSRKQATHINTKWIGRFQDDLTRYHAHPKQRLKNYLASLFKS